MALDVSRRGDATAALLINIFAPLTVLVHGIGTVLAKRYPSGFMQMALGMVAAALFIVTSLTQEIPGEWLQVVAGVLWLGAWVWSIGSGIVIVRASTAGSD